MEESNPMNDCLMVYVSKKYVTLSGAADKRRS
jgi:hypothetical protein